ncbi:MAG: Helix-turn-helix domain [Bacteroidetes bacterium]|nr:Helix-turn-helix domain [Bacteroidota bacterium]
MLKLILLLNPIYVTFFWFLVLNANKKKGNVPKIFLGKFMAIASLLYISHLLFYYPLPEIYHYTDALYHFLSLLVYPMYYVYIRLLTVDGSFSLRKHGIYFVLPLVMFILYASGIIMMSKNQHLEYLYKHLPTNESLSGIFLYQKTVYIISRMVFIIQCAVYLLISFKLVRENKKTVENYYTNTDEDRLNKIQWLNISLLITTLGGIALSAIGKENFLQSEIKLLVPSVIFSVALFFIGWLGNMQRPVLTTNDDDVNCQEREKNPVEISNTQLTIIKQKIQQLFEEEKIYLNKDLTIWEVSRVIGTNRTYISMVINNDFKQNFSSYVNNYRVQYARMLLRKNPYICKEDLAEMSGFGSVMSMKRAFHANDLK